MKWAVPASVALHNFFANELSALPPNGISEPMIWSNPNGAPLAKITLWLPDVGVEMAGARVTLFMSGANGATAEAVTADTPSFSANLQPNRPVGEPGEPNVVSWFVRVPGGGPVAFRVRNETGQFFTDGSDFGDRPELTAAQLREDI